VVVPAALFVSPAESSLRQEGGFLKIKWWLLCLFFREPLRTSSGVWGAQQLVSEHPRFDVGSSVDSRASVAVWRRSCVDLRAALRLFVGLCVDLKTACRLLEELIRRSR